MAGNVGLWAAIVIAGCAKPAPPPAAVEIVFGDCAPADARFVVGPVARPDTVYGSRGVYADVLGSGAAFPYY